MKDKNTEIDVFLKNIDLQEIWNVVKIGEPTVAIQDDNYGNHSESGGTIQILFRDGNYDALVKVTGTKSEKDCLTFRSYQGGGDDNVYKALAILAYAIKTGKDNLPSQ